MKRTRLLLRKDFPLSLLLLVRERMLRKAKLLLQVLQRDAQQAVRKEKITNYCQKQLKQMPKTTFAVWSANLIERCICSSKERVGGSSLLRRWWILSMRIYTT